MARIAGVVIPAEKQVQIALTYIYGIGRSTSNSVLKAAGVNPDTRAKNLSEDDVSRITSLIQQKCKAIFWFSWFINVMVRVFNF